LNTSKKIYFASDFHLGAPNQAASVEREKKIVRWLRQSAADARQFYILGDLFDFWYEYAYTVPKGYTRLIGTLAEITDSGIPIEIFTGNHDLWMKNYLTHEAGLKIHYKPQFVTMDGMQFYLAHGDGLGPGDAGFKRMKKIFTNPAAQWIYSRLHPNLGIGLATWLSRRSRRLTGVQDAQFLGEDKEWLILHSREILQQRHVDYFVYGHRHFPMMLPLNEKSIYINLGDWITYFTYGVWDGERFELKKFEG
jgi:UDP-2,3-diacylglucosamine hydrolase